MPAQTDLATDPDTLEMLGDVARSLAGFDADRLRRLRDQGGMPDREQWRRYADAGWLSILVSEDDGGAGLALDACTVIARQLGRSASLDPYVACGVLAPALLVFSESGQREPRLGALIAGEELSTVAWPATVRATDRDGVARLHGQARCVAAPGVDHYLVPALTSDGVDLFAVAAADIAVDAGSCADGSAWADLAFEHTPADCLLSGGAAESALAEALDIARVACAAELLGVMDRALELTLTYLRDRQQFGVPIGSFQVLQHRAVDAWMQRQLTEAAVVAAVKTHLDPQMSTHARAMAASSAKARAAHAAPSLCATALQLHGAIGFTDEYDLGFYINRALTLAPWLGNAVEHRRRYVELERAA